MRTQGLKSFGFLVNQNIRTRYMAKPFLKWAGGKGQLIGELSLRLPTEFNRYFEPFIGGGAFFFSLAPKKATIADSNAELASVYEVVRDDVDALIEDLQKHVNDKDYYYAQRALDRDQEAYQRLSKVQRASRFIYLNKTCFNGIYRVNSKGENNVPFGGYKNPNICDPVNLRACSKALEGVTVYAGDFTRVSSKIKKGDLVYLDPPYVPLSSTASFTSYTADGFSNFDHQRLKQFCDEIHAKGAYFIVSNSYTDAVLELYGSYEVDTVMASRFINADAAGRGKVKEVLVRNFK